jgi:hypothetical protein
MRRFFFAPDILVVCMPTYVDFGIVLVELS